VTDRPAPADVLPHRPPFLFLDEVTALVPGERAAGRWTPGSDVPIVDVGRGPQVPAPLVVEAIAQLGAYGAMVAFPESGLPLFARLDEATFDRPVRPGATVDLVVDVDRLHRRGGRGSGRATVDGSLVATTRLGFVFVPDPR